MAIPRMTLANFFVIAVEFISEIFVTTKRVDSFLKLPEHRSDDRDQDPTGKGTIEALDGNFGWHSTKEEEQRNRANTSERLNPDTSRKVSTLHRLGYH